MRTIKLFALIAVFALVLHFSPAGAIAGSHVIRDQPGWPIVFKLNIGDSCKVKRVVGGKTIERAVKLISVSEHWEPDYWIEDNQSQRTICKADVVVEVSGIRATLTARPYQMPVIVNGLKLYVETTRRWKSSRSAGIRRMDADVSLSAVAENESWGPTDMVFPIRNYRWRSSTYNNTWASLVPYNRLYYHRGDDFGAIPDRLPVVASMEGKVIRSPLPDGDGRSNGLTIKSASGMTLRFAHMNIETIDPTLTAGTQVQAGRVLGKTGMTWAGRKSQSSDPHLHMGFRYDKTVISTYPFLVEAYLRMYDDRVLAVAGGYQFATPGQTIELDGSRSVPRQGRKITTYQWRLHNDKVIKEPKVQVSYRKPGLYSEELVVRTNDGSEDRDFVQVRVYDPNRGRHVSKGWFYHTPVRGIRPGTKVLFWNRLYVTRGRVAIDFGDGTPPETIDKEIYHTYNKPGIYTVTLRATNPTAEPAVLKMRVVVEPNG